uniref:Uncharacterized protein n=1 Tax=Caenorhabditis japonica TaxID=281687 RepID=A0A8R1ETX1_CAEJA
MDTDGLKKKPRKIVSIKPDEPQFSRTKERYQRRNIDWESTPLLHSSVSLPTVVDARVFNEDSNLHLKTSARSEVLIYC